MPARRRTAQQIAQDDHKKAKQVTAAARKRVERLEADLVTARARVLDAERRERYAADHPDMPQEPTPVPDSRIDP